LAVRPIRTLPDPVLRAKTVRIKDVPATMGRLIEDMVDSMRAAHGVGLAANQIGMRQRVAVIEIPDEEVRIFLNPEIVKREGEREVEEGCLSVPGYRGTLTRSEKVTVKAIDLKGKPFRLKAEGLLAQALEHETDHLSGIVYIDHLESPDDLYKIEEDEDEEVDSDPEGDSAAEESGLEEAHTSH
jgi:peptide deformylase